jgi:predicted nucleotidyltransferase
VNLSEPATSLLPTLRARILTALAGADDGLTGRGLADLAGTSVSSTARVLDTLVDGGLVHRVQVGSAWLYRLNRDHLAASAVLDLAGMRPRLLAKLAETLRDFEVRPVTAVLFGSAARGDGDSDSDIDLLLVRPDGADEDDPAWAGDVHRLIARVQAWTGNAVSILEYSESDLRQTLAEHRRFARELRRDHIHLYGKRLPPVRVAARKQAVR